MLGDGGRARRRPDDRPPRPEDSLRPSARAVRYGVAVALVIIGILCGAAIPGTTGGTICTAVVGTGLVGVVSLVFYDVGLTEDRDRARPPDAAGNARARDGVARVDGAASAPPHPPGEPGPRRPLARMRGQRRRLR